MKADIWMPFYIGDYLRDTMHLSNRGHGSYLLLLFACWVNGGHVDDDDETLANIARLSPSDWVATRPNVARFFKIGNGKWEHLRVLRELKRANMMQDAFRQGAAKTNQKRWKRPSDTPSDTPSDAPSDALGDTPSPSPSPSQEGEEVASLPHAPEVSVPDLEDVLSHAKMQGITEASAAGFFNYHEAENRWQNRTGQLINWRFKLKAWAENDRANPPLRKGHRSRQTASPVGQQPGETFKEYEARVLKEVLE